jgi:hypothetical protein
MTSTPSILSRVNSSLPSSTSPLGRKLNFSGRVANAFLCLPPRAVQITIIALTVLAGVGSYLAIKKPIVAVFLPGYSILFNPLRARLIYLSIAAVWGYLLYRFIAPFAGRALNEHRIQQKELAMINALGGKEKFNEYVTKCEQKESSPIHISLGTGVVIFNLYLKRRSDRQELEISFVFSHNRKDNEWRFSTPQILSGSNKTSHLLLSQDVHEDFSTSIEKLVKGTHEEYALVEREPTTASNL